MLNICFCVVFATTSTLVSVIYWYACIFTAGLKELLFFLYGNILREIKLATAAFSAFAINSR